MKKLVRDHEVRLLVEILYEKGMINRATYLSILDRLKEKSKNNAA